MSDLISVIVPVYNSEKTIDYCVESIVKQTYKNLEILLVENGSTDKTLEICQKWAAKDSRIICVQSEKGVSKARNLGLSMMNGKYFAFVDSDDYIHETTYEKLYSEAEKEKADMTFCYTNSVSNENITYYNEKMLPEVVYNKNIRYFFYRGEESVRTGTIRTLFLKSLYGDIRYNEEICYSEDFLYMLECMDRSKKRALIDDALYYNVNFHNVPFLFAKKYKGRYHFFESAQIFADEAEKYLIKNHCEDIANAPKFDGLILLINAIVGSEKHYLKEIHKFVSQSYWKQVNNRKNYKQYLKVVCSSPYFVKLKAFLIVNRLYLLYGITAKLFAKIKG